MIMKEMRGKIIKQLKSTSGKMLDVVEVELVDAPDDHLHIAVPLTGIHKFVDWDGAISQHGSPLECVVVKVHPVKECASYILKNVGVV